MGSLLRYDLVIDQSHIPSGKIPTIQAVWIMSRVGRILIRIMSVKIQLVGVFDPALLTMGIFGGDFPVFKK